METPVSPARSVDISWARMRSPRQPMKSSTPRRTARSPITWKLASDRKPSVPAMKTPVARRAASCRGSKPPKSFASVAATHMKSGALSKYGSPAMRNCTQSPLRSISVTMPKTMPSSNFQGSCATSPGSTQAKHTTRKSVVFSGVRVPS